MAMNNLVNDEDYEELDETVVDDTDSGLDEYQGNVSSNDDDQYEPTAEDGHSSWIWSVIGFILGPFGFLLWAMWKNPELDIDTQNKGLRCMRAAVSGTIFWIVLIVVIVMYSKLKVTA